METKIFKNLEELNKYYNEETNTYIFKEGENWFDVDIQFCLEIQSDINACDINACDIKACDINACDIVFYAICIATNTLICKSIIGERNNAKYLCLDSKPVIDKQRRK